MRPRVVGEALKWRGGRRTADIMVRQSVIQLVLLCTVDVGVCDLRITYTRCKYK